jgi:regulator of sirC expression with transglutaminase-like and TPR domain
MLPTQEATQMEATQTEATQMQGMQRVAQDRAIKEVVQAINRLVQLLRLRLSSTFQQHQEKPLLFPCLSAELPSSSQVKVLQPLTQ